MNREIQVHQVLHGYHNGHQLLSSSMEFSFPDRRLLDAMSDGAGIGADNCMDGYITGYALPESRKYVLAKTWYADGMARPGCVWTHSLIFDMEDMKYVSAPDEILGRFQKPLSGDDKRYAAPILLTMENHLCKYELGKLQYAIYTIYGTDKAKYVEVEDDGYLESVILILCHMPERLLRRFSFCSNSLINRSINGSPFSYQMVAKENVYRVCSPSVDSKLYRWKEGTADSPAWARQYARAIVQEKLDEIEVFVKIFYMHLYHFSTYNQILRLFFITKEMNDQYSLQDYCDILKKLSEDNYQIYLACIINELICGDYFDSFYPAYFEEIVDYTVKNRKKLNKRDKDIIAQKALDKKAAELPRFLSQYIHGVLKTQAADVAHKIIMRAEPEKLKQISNMDHDIVVVAVAANSQLIFSRDIWRLPRDYQCDVINALDGSLSYDQWLTILSFIFENSMEDVSEAVYNKTRDKLAPILLDLFEKTASKQYGASVYFWDKYLLSDQISLSRRLPKIASDDLRQHLLLKMDTYNETIRNSITSEEWLQLFRLCSFDTDSQKLDMAIKMLPLILENHEAFPDDVVGLVFRTLHQELANSRISYEAWSMFENWLPTVDLCYSWDRCLRLRKAFENMHYDIGRLLQ